MPAQKFQSTNELLSDIDREWTLLMQVVARLSPEQMTAPDSGGWSPKDNLAHLAEWISILMGHHMDQRPAHEVWQVSEDVTKDWDMQVINPVLFERNRNRSTPDVLEGLKRVYLELIDKLKAMPFGDLLRPRHPDHPEQGPLLNWVLGDSAEHFAEHRETIERSLE